MGVGLLAARVHLVHHLDGLLARLGVPALGEPRRQLVVARPRRRLVQVDAPVAGRGEPAAGLRVADHDPDVVHVGAHVVTRPLRQPRQVRLGLAAHELLPGEGREALPLQPRHLVHLVRGPARQGEALVCHVDRVCLIVLQNE